MNLLESALHDGAVVLDAYARFATTLMGTLIFPYAAMAPARNASGEEAETPAHSPQHLPPRRIVQVAIALLVGVILGRRLFGPAARTR